MFKPNFFNWQGNHMKYFSPGPLIATAMIILIPIILFIFRSKLVNWFAKKEHQKILIFKNLNSFLQFLGIIALIIAIARIFVFSFYKYPLQWEIVPLHLCRLHFYLIIFAFIFKKKELLSYMAYYSFIAAIIGISFGKTEILEQELKSPGSIWAINGITHYSAGIDSYFFWDFIFLHLIVGIIPILFTISLKIKISTKNFYRVYLIYFGVVIVLWLVNIATDQSSNINWRSNYWYLGKDRNNNFSTLIGFFTSWPQNVVFFVFFGLIIYYISHFVAMIFRGNFKENFKSFVKDHNRNEFKNFWNFKLDFYPRSE